jgi:hypothetical protein
MRPTQVTSPNDEGNDHADMKVTRDPSAKDLAQSYSADVPRPALARWSHAV